MLAESRVAVFRGHSRDVVLAAFSVSPVISPNLRALLLDLTHLFIYSHLLLEPSKVCRGCLSLQQPCLQCGPCPSQGTGPWLWEKSFWWAQLCREIQLFLRAEIIQTTTAFLLTSRWVQNECLRSKNILTGFPAFPGCAFVAVSSPAERSLLF